MRGFLKMGLLLGVAIAITAIVAESMQTWQVRNGAARSAAASAPPLDDAWGARPAVPTPRTREAFRQ